MNIEANILHQKTLMKIIYLQYCCQTNTIPTMILFQRCRQTTFFSDQFVNTDMNYVTDIDLTDFLSNRSDDPDRLLSLPSPSLLLSLNDSPLSLSRSLSLSHTYSNTSPGLLFAPSSLLRLPQLSHSGLTQVKLLFFGFFLAQTLSILII